MARLEVEEVVSVEQVEGLLPWYVSWSGVWVGALSAFALLLVFGLTGIAVGAHQLGQRIASWHEFRLITLVFSVFGSFLSFVIEAGWWRESPGHGGPRPLCSTGLSSSS